MSFETTIAYHVPTATIKNIREVNNGLACECICEECNKKLEAVQSKEQKRKWYFRHYNKSNCIGGFESALHKYAKQLIIENNSIVKSKNEILDYVNPIAEYSIQPYRPDITLSLPNGEKVYIEIYVSNRVKDVKRDFFIVNKFKAFEINLSEIKDSHDLVDAEQIKRKVLQDYANREILYWTDDSTFTDMKSDSIIWKVLFFLFGVWLINKFLKNR